MRLASPKISSQSGVPQRQLAILVILVGLGWGVAWPRWKALTPDGINNGMTSEFPGPDSDQMRRLQKEFGAAVGLPEETVTSLTRFAMSNPRQAMVAAGQLLTSDQKVSAGLFMMNQIRQRDERLARMLSPDDYRYLRERRARMMGRNGRFPWARPEATRTR
jgi:hypothetical protein